SRSLVGRACHTPTRRPRARGDGTGSPVKTAYARAQSATDRAIGPIVSNDGANGKQPRMSIFPLEGLKPTVPQQADGMRTEPPVSVPRPSAHKWAASAAAFPPLEPPGVRVGRRGFLTSPQWGF